MAEHATIGSFAALAWSRGDVGPWLPAIFRMLDVPQLDRLVVATDDPRARDRLPIDPRLGVVAVGTFGEVLRSLSIESETPILVMTGPTMLPEMGLEPALAALGGDGRVASVSFLSNAAGYLSFPHRNRPTQYSIEGYDETSLTRRLRAAEPALLPAPIAAPAGAATLLNRDCVLVTGGPDEEFGGDPETAIVEMVLRASRRGLRPVLDPATFVTRLWDGRHWGIDPLDDVIVRRRLNELHPFFPALHDVQRRSSKDPLGLAISTAQAKIRGLKIVIDASALGPIENGTQVQTLALIEALSRRDDVHSIGVGLHGAIPQYAVRVLGHAKVRTLRMTDHRFRHAPKADILHRPFQPTGGLPWMNWNQTAHRTLVTLQDLIAYGIGAYHDEPSHWMNYRRGIRQSINKADGVIVISHDVAADLRRERLPVIGERTFVVENGTDHLRGDEPEAFPAELLARGWAARDFVIVLGANYSHKNRDLAIRTFKLLRETHPSLGLILAGVAVAEGSSRVLEVTETRGAEGVVTLPDVTSEERNWLLRHASLCLYPTSAEGFGLVPFEAARFGTPTVHTRFGPLAEVLNDVPVTAESWDPNALAAACEQLLADPQLAAEQVSATLKCGSRYTWDETAALLVAAYRKLLAQPAR